jgi:hypothetical protein
VDVLTSLSKRRAELDARERDVEMRENLIKAAEDRVDSKIADLKQLQTQIQACCSSTMRRAAEADRFAREDLFFDEAEGCRTHLRQSERRRSAWQSHRA